MRSAAAAENDVLIDAGIAPNRATHREPHTSYLALLISTGKCLIKSKSLDEHKWPKTVADLVSVWKDHCKIKHVSKTSRDCHLTAFSWISPSLSSSSISIVCVTSSGKFIFYSMPISCVSSKTSVEHDFDSEQPAKINQIKWIPIGGNESMICTANVLGQVKLYRIIHDSATHQVLEVSKCLDITEWKMVCTIECLIIEYDAESNQIIVLICLGSRLACYFLPLADFQAKSKQLVVHSIDQRSIVGKYTCRRLSRLRVFQIHF